MSSIGKLRSKIEIYTTTKSTIDEIGGVRVNTLKSATMWAAVRKLSGSRTNLGPKVENVEVLEFTVRVGHYSVVTSNEIMYSDRLYTIHSVENTIPANYTKIIAYTKVIGVI